MCYDDGYLGIVNTSECVCIQSASAAAAAAPCVAILLLLLLLLLFAAAVRHGTPAIRGLLSILTAV